MTPNPKILEGKTFFAIEDRKPTEYVECVTATLARTIAEENVYLRNQIACAVNALTDSVLCSGNDPETNLHWVRKLKKTLEHGRG